jgi:hypothetical protein
MDIKIGVVSIGQYGILNLCLRRYLVKFKRVFMDTVAIIFNVAAANRTQLVY